MTAQTGDRVRIHYTVTREDGSVFDSSRDGEPVDLTLGESEILPSFEEVVVGMSPGETRSAQVSNAFGQRREELVLEFLPEDLPDGEDSQVGDRLTLRTPSGHSLSARIVAISESGVTLDANHPFAGVELIFEVELIAIDP